MGQKVHPTGLRLGIGQGWDSSWSPDLQQNSQQYRDLLHIDIEIRNLIVQLFNANNGYAYISCVVLDKKKPYYVLQSWDKSL